MTNLQKIIFKDGCYDLTKYFKINKNKTKFDIFYKAHKFSRSLSGEFCCLIKGDD